LYRVAGKLNDQSGWGLSEGDLKFGRLYLRDTYINPKIIIFTRNQKKKKKSTRSGRKREINKIRKE